MIASNGPHNGVNSEEFPREETFTDCCGQRREFTVDLLTTDGGFFLRAHEKRKGNGGYEFAAHSEASPFLALGRLRKKIEEGLATRYTMIEDGQCRLSHDKAVGVISYGAVLIDGEEIPFGELISMLQSYEGWQFSLTIADAYAAFPK